MGTWKSGIIDLCVQAASMTISKATLSPCGHLWFCIIWVSSQARSKTGAERWQELGPLGVYRGEEGRELGSPLL